MKLLSVDEARRRMLAPIEPLEVETVDLPLALGRVLASTLRASEDLPRFHHSSMDGYAVRAVDTQGASESAPVQLRVIGEAAAGHQHSPSLEQDQAIRITTGAALPAGADAIVPVEATDHAAPMAGENLPEVIAILEAVDAGSYVRPAGLDVKRGELVLQGGHRLRTQDLGLLAALGFVEVEVFRTPRVGVLSTGDEVLPLGEELAPGKVRDTNGVMISSMLVAEGCIPVPLGVAGDTHASVRDRLEHGLSQGVDLILTTAGVSMGAHDHVRAVLAEEGTLDFWKVNVRPGKPLAYGSYSGIPFLGLPGNPVSAWTTFFLFARSVIWALQGSLAIEPPTVKATLKDAIHSDGRESYLRAIVARTDDGYEADLTGSQDSAVLSSLVRCNGLVRVPPGTRDLDKGNQVEVLLFEGQVLGATGVES